MTDDKRPKSRVRGFVGMNVSRILESRGLRHEDLADRVRSVGLGAWDQSVVSRLVNGSRALTFEETVVLAAALGVPVVDLVAGDEQALLGRQAVPLAQVRDVVTYGRVGQANIGESALDALSTAASDRPGASLASQLADRLGITAQEVEKAARKLWPRFDLDEELQRRMNDSFEAFTGLDPTSVFTAFKLTTVDTRRRRAWRAHHVLVMAEELGEFFEGSKR